MDVKPKKWIYLISEVLKHESLYNANIIYDINFDLIKYFRQIYLQQYAS